MLFPSPSLVLLLELSGLGTVANYFVAEAAAQKVKETVGSSSAKGEAEKKAGELKGEAEELAGKGKGKAEEVAGEAKGKAKEAAGNFKS